MRENHVSTPVSPRDLARWCAVPVGELVDHPDRRVPFRMCADSLEMGRLMAQLLLRTLELPAAPDGTPGASPIITPTRLVVRASA